MRRAAALLLTLPAAAAVAADEVYQAPAAFVAEAFGGQAPAPELLWLTGEVRRQAAQILGHEPGAARARYWRRDARTAWVLEEIGKERPITVGFVVEDGRIAQLEVLAYRESRGWEVRLPAFVRQFAGAALTPSLELDRGIDNISGATLSVNALRRLARLALYYHRQVTA